MCDAVGALQKKGYTWAIHKRANKKTARITILDDTLRASTDVTVHLETLWQVHFVSLARAKATIRHLGSESSGGLLRLPLPARSPAATTR